MHRPEPTAGAAAFRAAYPGCDLDGVDELRRREYGRLDAGGHVYLDYTGGSLHADSQVRAHQRLLREEVLGNPHSTNPTLQRSTELADRAGAAVLRFASASPDEYAVVFTPNATGALRLVGEAFPFERGGRLLLTADNHNSVNGIRELARARGARVTYAPIDPTSLRLDAETLTRELGDAPVLHCHLFASPARSNFSGVQHALSWIERARDRGWRVLLDAAAFAPTNRLDLGRHRPDFVALSFYKLFGYPTGIGCLLARRDALAELRRPWFAGGTITVVSVLADDHFLAEGEAAFEDGTIDYLGLPAVEIGLRHLESVGVDAIHERVRCLTSFLLSELGALRRRIGAPLVRIYGPETTDGRGGTVAFNVLTRDGSVVDYRAVETEANRRRISLRTGCFCNPGAREAALGFTEAELTPLVRRGHLTVDEQRELLRGRPIGAVRVSVGIVSTPDDVARLVELLRGFPDRPTGHWPARLRRSLRHGAAGAGRGGRLARPQ